MLTKDIGKMTKRVLSARVGAARIAVVVLVAVVLAASGLAGMLFGTDLGGTGGMGFGGAGGTGNTNRGGNASFPAECVYADTGDYASQVIPDEKLASVIRMLVNYFEETGGKNLYTLIASDEYKTLFEEHGTRITDYIDPAVPGTKSLVELYDKPISQAWMEDYNGVIDLTEYTEITDLTGLNAAIKVTSVTIPKNCTAVPGKAFESMMKLSVVLVPSTVTAIGDGAFEKCESLKSLLIYDPETTIVIAPVDEQQRPVANIIYLKGITKIGNSAFKSCSGIKKVDFGEDVQIGSDAFNSCTSLADVVVPKGTLGIGVFSACNSMNTIVFDESYTKIPDNTLSGITGDLTVTFPENLEEIGAYAIAGETTIKAMNLTSLAKLKTIGAFAFKNAKIQLDSMDLSGCKSLTTIGREAFAGTTFQNVALKFPDALNKVGCAVFFMARGIVSVDIPNSLYSIPDGAFMYCYELEQILNGKNIRSIGKHAFDLCGHLDHIDVKAATGMYYLNNIGEYAFARCIPAADELNASLDSSYGLKKVELNYTTFATKIDKSAFEDDFMVKEVLFPYYIHTIPENFLRCREARSPEWADIVLHDPVTDQDYTYPIKSSDETAYKNMRDRFTYKNNISDMSRLETVVGFKDCSIEEIGDYAFFGNKKLDSFGMVVGVFNFSNNVKKIGKYAFANCAGRTGTGEDMSFSGIDEVIFPESFEELGEYAFANDYNLKSVSAKGTIEEIPDHCFDGCGFNNQYKETYKDDQGTEHMTDLLDHYHGLESIFDLRNVKKIGDYAFNGCLNLSKSTKDDGIEFGRPLTALGKYAFARTAIVSASTLVYSEIEAVNEGAFDGCRNLTKAYCPDTVTSIGNYAFRNCPALTTLSFPVYATLSEYMISKNEQSMTLTPTLGRYLNTRFKVPVSQTISLPANAFARKVSDKISQVYVDGPHAGEDVEIDKADPQYFQVSFDKNQYLITGGKNEVLGTAVRISATVPFRDSSNKTMNIDYPLDVTNTHADPETLEFNQSKIKIGSSSAGTIFKKDGDLYLYINKAKIGSTLTIALDAKSTDEDFPGIITDAALWSSSDSSVLALKEDSVTKTTGAEKTTTTAQFDIKATGEAVASGGFDDTEAAQDPEIKLHICVVEPIKSIDFTLGSIGDDYKNMSSLYMPEEQTDKIDAVPVYTSEDDKRDFLIYSSADPTVVSVDQEGNLTALKAGKAKITAASATGSTKREMTVTVVEKGAYVTPLYVNISGPIGPDNKGIVYCNEASCFKATFLPSYASQNVSWTISSTDAALEVKDGDAYLTGVNPNKTMTLTAQAINDTTLGSAKATLSVATHMKASELDFREEPPTILIEEVKNFRLSNDDTQTGGIVRKPATSYEAVTFTSGDPEKLLLGTSKAGCTESAVALTGQSGTLYYKGIKGGETTITAETESGVKAVLKVTVKRRPEDVTDAHAVADTTAFNASAFKIGSSGGLTPFEKDGMLYLYINKSKIGNTLTLAVDGKSDDKDYPNIITDDPEWTLQGGSALALKADSVKKTVGTEKTLTTAVFDITEAGETEVRGGFVDETGQKKVIKTIKVIVLDPIKSFDLSLGSTGEDHKNISSVTMPGGQKDKIEIQEVYTDEEDKRDFILFTSADPETVSVDKDGNLNALKPGKARITMASVSGSYRREITVTVAEEGAYISPLFIDIKGPVENNKGAVYCDAASTFKAACLPDYASQSVKWTVSSADATLEVRDGEAYVTGVTPNRTVTLTAQATDGDTVQSAKTNLQVVTNRRAETVQFKEAPPFIKANEVKSLTLSSNASQTNGVIRTPADSWDKVTFTSSDPTVLTLGTSQDKCTRGQLILSGQSPRLYYMGFRNGTATITARTATGSESVLVVTIVTAPVTSLRCTEPAVTLIKNRTAQMKVEITPEVSTDQITYTSSDEKIVTVDENGLMKAVATGYATITAKSRVNGRSTTCRVTVLGSGQTVTVGTANYTVYKDGTLIFTSKYNTGKTVTVPDTVKISGNSYKVTRIAKSALRYNSTVTKVVIGANVTWIGADAFNNNANLKTLEVKTQKLKTLGKRVVKSCKRGMTIRLKKAKFKAYKKMFKKSGVPAKTKYKKF